MLTRTAYHIAVIGFFSVLMFGPALTIRADLVVDYRYSQGGFDVSAGVGGNSDRHRVVPPAFENLSGAFSMSETYTATASSTEPPVIGTADAFGMYSRLDELSWNANAIFISASESASGWATSSGGGSSFSDMGGLYQVDFTVTGSAARFHITGDFDPANPGFSEVKIEGPFFGQLQFQVNAQQMIDATGILQPGSYRFLVQNGNSAFSIEGASDPPFSGGHNISLMITSVPEPNMWTFLGLGAVALVSFRRSPKRDRVALVGPGRLC